MFTYEINDCDEVVITGIENKNIKELEIPSQIDGCFVSCIDRFAFAGCINLEKVTFPECYVKISFRAFDGCSSLKEVVLPECYLIEPQAFRGCPYEK